MGIAVSGGDLDFCAYDVRNTLHLLGCSTQSGIVSNEQVSISIQNTLGSDDSEAIFVKVFGATASDTGQYTWTILGSSS